MASGSSLLTAIGGCRFALPRLRFADPRSLDMVTSCRPRTVSGSRAALRLGQRFDDNIHPPRHPCTNMEAEPHTPQSLTIQVSQTRVVSGLLLLPDRARACLVLAHGAGAGMTHPFMIAAAAGLSERGIGTLRYQFPYMEAGSRRPDGPGLAQATVRAAVNEANVRLPDLALFAGGKSFGGRMTSQAQAEFSAAKRARHRLFRFPTASRREALCPSGSASAPKSKSLCFSCRAIATRSRNRIS